MARVSLWAAAVVVLCSAVGACDRHGPSDSSPQPADSSGRGITSRQGTGMPALMTMGDRCPMLVRGTTVEAADTSDGTAMTFSTTGDVDELRRRVHEMADHMNDLYGSQVRGMGDANMGGGEAMGGLMPAVQAHVDGVERGVRLTVSPKDPAKADEVRQYAKQRADVMNQSHACS